VEAEVDRLEAAEALEARADGRQVGRVDVDAERRDAGAREAGRVERRAVDAHVAGVGQAERVVEGRAVRGAGHEEVAVEGRRVALAADAGEGREGLRRRLADAAAAEQAGQAVDVRAAWIVVLGLAADDAGAAEARELAAQALAAVAVAHAGAVQRR